MADEKTEGREQYWSELDTDGRIERMRQVVKSLERELFNLIEMKDKFDEHSHQDGRVMLPAIRRHEGMIGQLRPTGKGDEVYF